MSKADLKALADRVERLEGGDPATDRAISKALDIWWMPDSTTPGPWTFSLDAAMMLVPEGWSISVGEMMGLPEHIRWRAHLRDHRPQSLTEAGHSHIWVEGNTCSAALALCAAALRANKHLGDGHE